MSPTSRMKAEMMRASHATPAHGGLDAILDAADLPDGDKAEVRRFAAFLKDSRTMPLPALIEAHGAAYPGFTAAEVERIQRAAASKDADATP